MLLIFDCDGVVIDSEFLHSEAEAICFQELGISITQAQLKERFSGVSDVDMFKRMEGDYGIAIPADFKMRLNNVKKNLFTKKLKAIDGIHQALEQTQNIPRCIASSSNLEMLDHNLKLTNLYELFRPRIFSSQMVARGKPFPDLFLYAIEKMGQRPEDSIVIEDSIAGVQAGKAAGSQVIGFIGGSHCCDQHKNLLTEAGADQILSSMFQLPKLVHEFYN